MTLKYLLLCLFAGCLCSKAYSQCSASEAEVSIIVTTTNRGYEVYWELVPDTNLCGSGTIFKGGNLTQMTCSSANANLATPGNGYANFDTISEGPWCLTAGATYSIRFVDDEGASENHFTVMINGFPVYHFFTERVEHRFTFTVNPPLPYNLGLKKISTVYYQNPGDVTVTGKWFNYSSNVISSMDINYSIDNGPVVKQSLSGLSFAPFTEMKISHPDLWSIPSNGNYSLKLWADNLNGNSDMDPSNDTLVKHIVAGDSIPNIIDDYLQSTPAFNVIGDSTDQLFLPSDLDFHPVLSKNELWVVNRGTVASEGSTVTFYHAGTPSQVSLYRQDSNTDHFMLIPSGIAFSDNTNFATSSGILDAHQAGGHYAGPTLWSSDSLVYAQPAPGPLGSHLDMLHQSPYSMGIAAEEENEFWVFDGYNGRIMWYDFVEDHGPGFDDHADGLIRRYDDISIMRINDTIPSHLVLSKDGWLYVVDNGNSRVFRMDIRTGAVTGEFVPYAEYVTEHSIVTGVTWNDYITTGLVQPSGIDIIGDRMIVSDFSNGDIIIYDASGSTGVELGRLHTGSPGVAGLKIGPDGRIWFVNMLQHKLYRVEITTNADAPEHTMPLLTVYPNPANDFLYIESNRLMLPDFSVRIFDAAGRMVQQTPGNNSLQAKIDVRHLPEGIYSVALENGSYHSGRKFIIKR